MAELSNAGLLDAADVPEESLLGFLVGIVHHKFTTSQEIVDGLLEKSKLPEEYWPQKPKGINAFQASVRKLEEKYREVKFRDPGTEADIKFSVEFMVDALKDGSRQLTRKIHYLGSEKASKKLRRTLDIFVQTTQKEPEKMAKFTYDKQEDTITKTDLFKKDELNIEEMTNEKFQLLLDIFGEIKNSYTERYLKDAWFKLVRGEGGIPWLKKCGSLWFIPKDAKEYINAFGRVYNTIHGEEGTWRTIPVINTKQQREHLKEDVEIEFEDRFKSFLENIADRVRDDQVFSDLSEEEKAKLRKTKDNFESKMNTEFIARYNKLLDMSISAKLTDSNVKFESDRLNNAMELMKQL